MAGLGMMLAGAFEGLGNGIVEQARQRQEEAQAELDRQTRREERAQDRQWQVDDQNRQYQREDNLTASTASAYADVYGADAGGFDAYRDRVRSAESSGNSNAQNPNSTATGDFQFTEGTWGDVMKNHPELGLTADGRTNSDQQEAAFRAFTEDNAKILRSNDIATTGGNLYAAHFLGAGGATTVLRAPDDAALPSILPANVIEANPFLRDMTVSDFKQWSDRKGGSGDVFAVIANPNTPESVREDLRAGTGLDAMLGGQTATTNQFWRDNGDGTETRMGTDSRGNAVEVPGPDGQPLTQRQTRSGSAADATPLSAAVVRDITSRYTDPITNEVDYSIVDPLTAEIERLVGEGMTEQAAKADAISRMEYEQVTTPASSGFFGTGIGASPETTEQGKFLGTFREAGAAADAPAATGDAADQGDTSPKTVDQVRAMTEIDRAKYVESQGGMAKLPSDMIDLFIELG